MSCRTLSSNFKLDLKVVPAAMERSDARWMVGPSAKGSENGIPSSIKSEPDLSSVLKISSELSGSGSPAVT